MMRTTTLESAPAEVTQEPKSQRVSGAEAAHVAGAARISADAPVVLSVENLGKRFKIYSSPLDRLRDWVLGGKRHTEFWAVRGVSFEVRRGECLGIIGVNGSGKSTLLKMVAGALQPTEGIFHVHGRVLSLIELGTGLNPLLSGRANVVHAATLLGFPADFARSKMSEIESFADLGEFFERPVTVYSSGMRVRLAFSMFACFHPELFIVDEALSVGDIFFQQKCADRIRELLDDGMTMLFVSHDQSAVLNLCDRALFLNHGTPAFYGDPEEAVSRYLATIGGDASIRPRWRRGKGEQGHATNPEPPADEGSSSEFREAADRIIARDVIGNRRHNRHGAGGLLILGCRITDPAGEDTLHIPMGETLSFHMLVEAQEDVAEPRAGIRLFDRFNNRVFGAGTYQLRHTLPPMTTGDRLIVRFDLKMDVAPEQYTFGLGTGESLAEMSEQGRPHDRIDRLGPLYVVAPVDGHRSFHGIARLPMTIAHRRLTARGGA